MESDSLGIPPGKNHRYVVASSELLLNATHAPSHTESVSAANSELGDDLSPSGITGMFGRPNRHLGKTGDPGMEGSSGTASNAKSHDNPAVSGWLMTDRCVLPQNATYSFWFGPLCIAPARNGNELTV